MQSDSQNILTVSQLTGFIKEVLEGTFRTLTVEGEISNWRPSASGHIYFTLKDNAAQLKAVMFKSSAFRLNFRPKDGDKVRCTGNLSVYVPQGNYQLVVSRMEQTGNGDILQMLEERKRRLAAEGLFEAARKKPLPPFPKTIGVVTSPTGAAIRDILNVARRRNPSVNITVLPALVQGDEAVRTIVKMLEIANFYHLCDVLIVGRGGGSLEDLLPFSDEAVVRAVAASEIPVISAVGHEIDWAICDYAADVRAATPSAAAELAVPNRADVLQKIRDTRSQLYTSACQHVEKRRLVVRSFNPESLEIRFRAIQQPLLNRLDNAREQLVANMAERIRDCRTRITGCVTVLEDSSPQTIFDRGYSMVRAKKSGEIIRNAAQIAPGEEIEITPSAGKLTATVTATEVV